MSHRTFTWTSLPHSLPNQLLLHSLHQWQVPFSTLYSSLSSPPFSSSCFYPSYHFCPPTSLHPLFHSDQGSITSHLVCSNILVTGFLARNLARCPHPSSTEQRHRRVVLIDVSHQVTPVLNGFPLPLGQSLNSLPPLQTPCTKVLSFSQSPDTPGSLASGLLLGSFSQPVLCSLLTPGASL